MRRSRRSRRDEHSDSEPHLDPSSPWPLAPEHRQTLWPSTFACLHRLLAGVIRCSALPPVSFAMALRRRAAAVPEIPRVTSPSPAPSEQRHHAEYAAPRTRSAARRDTMLSQQSLEKSVEEDEEQEEDDDSLSGDDPPGAARKSRTRSRSPIDPPRRSARKTRSTNNNNNNTNPSTHPSTSRKAPTEKMKTSTHDKAAAENGHLAPPQPSGWSWRDFSRSPSPMGLIPIHRHWRTFVHKHEVPRKVLHVSIGAFVVWLYMTGARTDAVAPYLMAGLIPIALTDFLRHRYSSVNGFYVRCLGALMRESEYTGYNGVIWYLLGTWTVLYFLPKDVAAVSVLLLSWCDTAASTFGRLWGRYTPRLGRGKSLAGSSAAFLVGVAASFFWYGWLVPTFGPMPGDEDFMFRGTLSLPSTARLALGVSESAATVSGALAVAVLSLWNGFVASASEAVDLFGWDDNLTIPVLSGIGIWGFLKVFG